MTTISFIIDFTFMLEFDFHYPCQFNANNIFYFQMLHNSENDEESEHIPFVSKTNSQQNFYK
jgi:hypothetical protein